MGVGEMGQIIGETVIGETGVGEMGVIHKEDQAVFFTFLYHFMLHYTKIKIIFSIALKWFQRFVPTSLDFIVNLSVNW